MLFIGKNSFYPVLQDYFKEPIRTIRQAMFDSFAFNLLDHKVPTDVLVAPITITNDPNCHLLTRINAEAKIIALIGNCTDKVLIRLLKCVKCMVESLSVMTQKKEIKKSELCILFLQPCFRKLFDKDNNKTLFKWLNGSCFTESTENNNKTTGYFEGNPIKHSKYHKKNNIALHKLCTFAKTGSAKYNSRQMFQVIAVGTNVQVHISEIIDDILVVSELDNICLPLSLDELPQLIPYVDRFYDVVEVIHRLCYSTHFIEVNNSFGKVFELKLIKAIMENAPTELAIIHFTILTTNFFTVSYTCALLYTFTFLYYINCSFLLNNI